MSTGCDHFRNEIPRALLADIDSTQQQALDRHLAECAPCSAEKELYAQTFRRMHTMEDVPVPRHFLVYPEEHRANPWQLFRGLSLAWQGSIAAVMLILLITSGMAAARMQFKAEDGAYVINFGSPAPSKISPAPTPILDTAALEARILQAVEEKNRKESLEWIRTLRAEIARSQKGITRDQRTLLDTALINLETRMSARLDETARSLEERNSRSLSTFYQAMKLQRESDLAVVDSKLNRLALNGEIKSSQTDAILDTLIQVTDFRTK
jgi:hypothetical protein